MIKYSKIKATDKNKEGVSEPNTFYLIFSGNTFNIFPLDSESEPKSYDSMHDLLEEWSNVSKA